MQPEQLERLQAHLHDRYRIERELGRGGMATVYLARDVKHERRVAIKVLEPQIAASLGAERFLREIRIAAKLTHPHIVPLYDSGHAAQLLYYVMPFVEGESLRQRLTRERQLPLDEAVRLTREIADALASAHAHGIVHRDVKPENILLEEGHAVVSDFGIARAVTQAGGEGLTETGMAVGTPAYMSPEQATGTKDLDARTDVYSLGCVLYEMLAGTVPFTAATRQALIARHVVDAVPPLRTVRAGLPSAVEDAIMKALAKVPADRYAGPREFADALEREEAASRPAAATTPTNLPNPATRFFGRHEELQELAKLLSDERLVTIQGPGGCGKTRLALEAARRALGRYPEGVWFVGLAQLTNPDLVADALAAALQVQPETDRAMEYTVAQRIASKKMLVVLDNCEHLVDECARMLDVLLTNTEAPRFLATSREGLKVPGEALFPTPSLQLPRETAGLEEIVGSDAVSLFRDRVALNNPAFRLDRGNAGTVGEICRKLDGIPLAIEMAASRVKVMSPDAILERLTEQLGILSSGVRTAAPRHQTLRATIDWSADLLTEQERTFLHRLAIFAGDFDLEDAERVCAYEPLSPDRTLDLLTQLVDKSLVVAAPVGDGVRYHLLELMKQYGREKLAAAGDLDRLEAGFGDFYLAKTRTAYRQQNERFVETMTWLQQELYNLQGAWSLLPPGDVRRAELAGLLATFMFFLSRIGLAREMIGPSLRDYATRDVHRARGLVGLGFAEAWFGHFETGRRMVEEGIGIVRELDDADERLSLFWTYGMVRTMNREWDGARTVLEDGLRLAERRRDPVMCVAYRWCLHWIAVNRLRPDLIEDDVDELLRETVAAGHAFHTTVGRHIYADVPLQKGDYVEAERRYIEAARSALVHQSPLQAAIEMQGIAMALCGQGRREKGLRVFSASMAKWEDMGAQMFRLGFWDTCIARTVGKAVEAAGPERANALDAEGRRMGWDPALEYAFDMARD